MSKIKFFLFGLLITTALVISISPPVEATFKSLGSHSIGISLSKNCTILLKNNLTTNCPSYNVLEQLDTSNQEISGKFEYKDGYYQRGSAQTKEHYNYYSFIDDWIIFVDPPGNTMDRVKLITIENNFETYFTGEDMGTFSNETGTYRTFKQSIYVNDRCNSGTIDGKQWKELLPDMIFYLRNNCNDDFKLFNETKVVLMSLTTHDITTSQKYIHDQWVKDALERCKQKC